MSISVSRINEVSKVDAVIIAADDTADEPVLVVAAKVKAKKAQQSACDRRKSSIFNLSQAGSIINVDEQPIKGKNAAATSSSNNNSSRIQPLNDRLRSVFDLFRHRLNSSSVESKKTKSCSTSTGSAITVKTKSTQKKSAQTSKYLSVDVTRNKLVRNVIFS